MKSPNISLCLSCTHRLDFLSSAKVWCKTHSTQHLYLYLEEVYLQLYQYWLREDFQTEALTLIQSTNGEQTQAVLFTYKTVTQIIGSVSNSYFGYIFKPLSIHASSVRNSNYCIILSVHCVLDSVKINILKTMPVKTPPNSIKLCFICNNFLQKITVLRSSVKNVFLHILFVFNLCHQFLQYFILYQL